MKPKKPPNQATQYITNQLSRPTMNLFHIHHTLFHVFAWKLVKEKTLLRKMRNRWGWRLVRGVQKILCLLHINLNDLVHSSDLHAHTLSLGSWLHACETETKYCFITTHSHTLWLAAADYYVFFLQLLLLLLVEIKMHLLIVCEHKSTSHQLWILREFIFQGTRSICLTCMECWWTGIIRVVTVVMVALEQGPHELNIFILHRRP